MRKGRCFRQAITGIKQLHQYMHYQTSTRGDGSRVTMVYGVHTGHHYQMKTRHAPSYWGVVVWSLALEIASVANWRPTHQPVQVRWGCINNTDDLWYHLLCSVHYRLYVNRIYMQCDKNCMDLNIYGDQSMDSCTVLIILNECSCGFGTYSWVIDCWYFKLLTRLYMYIPE